MFTHDFAPESDGKGFTLLPDGEYELQITKTEERKTQKGYPMVNCECEVVNNPEYNGRKVFHNVSFLPKETDGKPTPGAGMSTHFMKCINQVNEGIADIDCASWVGEKFKAKLGSREYTKKDGTKATVNNIEGVDATDPF